MSATERIFFFLLSIVLYISGGACSPAGILSDAPLPQLKSLTGIAIESADSPGSDSISIAPETVLPLKVTGIFTDDSQSDITGTVTWTVSDSTIITMEGDVLQAHATGKAILSATLGSVTSSINITVTDGILTLVEVVPGNSELPLGLKKQYRALGTFSGTAGDTIQDITATVLWETTDDTLATVSETGKVETIAPGEVDIRATMEGVTGEAPLTVRDVTLTAIEITPYSISLPLGSTEIFAATGVFSDSSSLDLTDQVNWSVSDTEKVSIDGATASLLTLSKGSSTVFASMVNGMGETVTGIGSVSVNEEELVSIELNVSDTAIPLGLSGSVTATGIYTTGSSRDITEMINWGSSDEGIAAVSNTPGSKGILTTKSGGEVILTGTIGDIEETIAITVTGEVLQGITVTPVFTAVPLGLKWQMTATGTYSNSTRDITSLVTWSSAQGTIASISNADESRGQVSTLAEGASEISATLDGVEGSTTLTVIQEELVSIEITPGNSSLLVDLEKQFTATGVFTGSTCDITASVTWASSNSDVAIIDNNSGSRGLVTARTVGSTEISASMNGISAITSLTVTDSTVTEIQVMVFNTKIYTGYSGTCGAVAVCEDGSIHDVTEKAAWTVSDGSFAAVSNAAGSAGTVSAIKDGGTATIQVEATYGGKTGSGNVEIVGLDYLFFTSQPPSETHNLSNKSHCIWEDADFQYHASAHYADGNDIEITTLGTWKANGHIGYYSDADAWCDPGVPGLVHGENETSGWSSGVTIRVEFSIKSASTTVWIW